MKTITYNSVVLAALISIAAKAQTNNSSYTIDSLVNFNQTEWTNFYYLHHTNPAELPEFIEAHKRDYIHATYFTSAQKLASQPNTPQQACTNIDFENGNLSGWTSSTGYNPIYNAAGCCLTTGGAQVVTSGTALDACGGFPIVAPGGNFSVQLGDNNVGGIADRLEQTFNVTPANANFTYKYAVVLQDAGHAIIDQPSFQIEMLDSSNTQIPCTFYNVAAGQNIPGFLSSTNCASVVYKPWSSVSVDLTSYIGQNVTIRFTTYDCSLGGHYAYAYIDGNCGALQQPISDTICVGQSKTLCAPGGYASYLWNGSSINGLTNQCVNATNPGNFSVQTTQVTGCPGPTFNYSLHNFPTPNANFNTGNSASTCGLSVNFHNTSSMSSGNITTYSWDFGDGSTSSLENPNHTYANQGTYNVSLIVGSPRGCYDTVIQPITLNPQPVANFSFANGCQFAPVAFTDMTNLPQGNVNQWLWDFGDGSANATTQNPTHSYNGYGVYIITFTATSNQGCSATISQSITIGSKPTANFNILQSTPCSNAVAFSNTSNISSGSISTYQWAFGDGNTSINTNTFNNYANAGTYNVQLIVTSTAGCKDTMVMPVTISPLPTVAFYANAACANAITSFTNNSSVTGGSIISTNWVFGDGSFSSLSQPSHQYAGAGSYSVTLTVNSDHNCSNSLTQIVTVNPIPNVMFSANNVCQGNVTNYINNSNISSGSITNYVWDFTTDGTPDNTTQNTSNTFASSGTYTTQLMAISNLNCIQSFTQVINVYPNPVVQFTSQAVCFGAPIVFTNSSSISSGLISSYTWSFGDATTSSIANTQHVYSAFGNYNVQLTAISNHNCSSTLSQTAIVHPKPMVQFQSTTACLNQATQFNNQSSIATGSIIKYRWDFENDNSVDDSTSNPSYIYGLAGINQCRLVAISNNNCSNQNINPVVIHQNPVALFSAPSTCMPSSTQFQNLSTSSDGLITSNNWDFNGDNITDNIQQNPTYNFAQTGNYGVKLEVQTQYGCSNSVIKSAYVNATPSVLFAAQHKVGCPSLCVNFINNCSIGNGNIVTYQWIFGDISSPDYTQNPTHCYASGNYNVTLKAVSDSGCVASSMIPNFVTVYPTPIANFNVTPSVIEITEPLIEVEDKSTGATAINYVFSDGTLKNTANFTYLFTTDVAKTVFIMQKVVNSYGCRDSIVKQVDIKPAYALYIPNAFTPNSDGLNDGFKALGIGIAQFKLQIFDRWGVLIFESDDINRAWDGSVNGKGDYDSTKDDVYVWKAEVTDVLKQHHDLIGHVTLVK
jgi:gliding motility-associated-like protein